MIATDEEHAAFMRGFNLARPPGHEDAETLARCEEFAPAGPGQRRVAVSKDVARTLLAEVDTLPEHLAAAAWFGFLRGQIAKAGGAPVHVHESGRA